MPLIIGTTPNSQWQALTPLLNHLGWESQQENPETGYQNAENVDENTQYLLLHSRPELAVAHAMDAGASPTQALSEWSNAAKQLLDFYKRHRRKAVMVDAGSAAFDPQALISWLCGNHTAFYDRAQAPWPEDAPELSIPRPNHTLNQLLATQLIAQDQWLAGLLTQLEAATIPLSESTQPELDVAALHAELEQQKNAPLWEEDVAQAKAELGKAKTENNRLNQTVAGLQAELAQTKAQLEKASHAHENTAEQQQALKQESDLLLNQLHKVQEELENYYHKAQNGNKTTKELEAQTKQLAEQKQALETELQSTQSELTRQKSVTSAAEEALSRALSQNEVQHKDVLDENDLILKQLFQVQEELEKYYLESKDQSERLKKRDDELREYEQTLKNLRQGQKRDTDKLNARNERLESEKSSLRNEVAQLKTEVRQLNKEKRLLSSSLAERSAQPQGWTLASLVGPLRKVRQANRELNRLVELVRNSELFDAAWYTEQNPDVAAQSVDPALHYVKYGGTEGRAAGPQFDSESYLHKHPDVAEQGLNPLVHYLLHGKAEGRKL